MISGIIVNDGIFVKIARPKETPERNDSMLKCFGRKRVSKAKNIEVRINGNMIESKTTLLVNQLDGITAKSKEENNATVGLNFRSPIL